MSVVLIDVMNSVLFSSLTMETINRVFFELCSSACWGGMIEITEERCLDKKSGRVRFLVLTFLCLSFTSYNKYTSAIV